MELYNKDTSVKGKNMDIKNKKLTFPVLSVLGRVRWLDDSVIKNEGDDYLFPCGWTHSNMRLSLQNRDSRLFPATKFSDEQEPSCLAHMLRKSGKLCKMIAVIRKYVGFKSDVK